MWVMLGSLMARWIWELAGQWRGCCVLSFVGRIVLVFVQAEDGIRDLVRSRGLGDVYKRQSVDISTKPKPFERPDILSIIIDAETTLPAAAK